MNDEEIAGQERALALIRTHQFDRLGLLFCFTPTFTIFKGREVLNWDSAPPELIRIVGTVFVAYRYATPRTKGWPDGDDQIAKPPKPKPTKAQRHFGDGRKGTLPPPRLGTWRHALFVSQNGKCYYCFHDTPESKWTVDHRVARVNGGRGVANYVGCCWTCNHYKGDKSEEDFLASKYLENRRNQLVKGVNPLAPPCKSILPL